VIGSPPFAGVENVTVANVSPAETAEIAGALGTVAGITTALGLDAALVPVPPAPVPFEAVTVNVYDVPLVSPVTIWLVEVVAALVSVPPAGLEITVYPVIAVPPVAAAPFGAVKVTVA
jgi:hypothetical protein